MVTGPLIGFAMLGAVAVEFPTGQEPAATRVGAKVVGATGVETIGAKGCDIPKGAAG